MMKRRWVRQWLIVWFALLLTSIAGRGFAQDPLLYGFTAFPYDFTQEAIDKVHEIILPNSNFYPVHFGLGDANCVPWRHALANIPFPDYIQQEWQEIKSRIPNTHVVYIAVTPTEIGARVVASACGDGKGELEPGPFPNAVFDHPDVKTAYVNYVKRVVEFFQPRYLNIGVEISELSLRDPEGWPPYAALFTHTYDALKADYPQLQIGAEFVLQSLLLPRVADQVKPVVEKSDYLGLSFYPYGSEFGVGYGAPPLPQGTDQWRTPLDWVRQYTNKPLAICETGYLTQPLQITEPTVQFPGSESLQTAFLSDLIQIAKRDRYLFIVWFISIDYDRLYENLPSASESHLLWMHSGLFDKDLKPKPAWSLWQGFAQPASGSVQAQGPADLQSTLQEANSTASTADIAQPLGESTSRVQLGFAKEEDVFSCYGGNAELDKAERLGISASMRWQVTYSDEWSWCIREVPEGQLKGVESLKFGIKSDREIPIAIRLEESGGEIFHIFVQAGRDWKQEVQPLTNFQGNGRIEPGRIVRIVVADGGGVEDGMRGERTIWLTNLEFE